MYKELNNIENRVTHYISGIGRSSHRLHSFSTYFLNAYYVPPTALGSQDTQGVKAKNFWPCGACVLEEIVYIIYRNYYYYIIYYYILYIL